MQSFFYVLSISQIWLKEHAWERPLSAAQGSSCSGFSDECATRRPLTSLEEKIKVCERPDRLGSATNPEMSELGLPGLESSMNEKLWNEWKQGLDLPKKKKNNNNTWPNSSGETNTTSVQGKRGALSHQDWSMIGSLNRLLWEGEELKPVHHQTTTTTTNTSNERRTSTWEHHFLLISFCTQHKSD